MKRRYLLIALLAAGCAAHDPVQHTLILNTSGKKIDMVSQRLDNKDCPTGVIARAFDDTGKPLDGSPVVIAGNTAWCHAIDQIGRVAESVGLGVGLSNMDGDKTSVNNSQSQSQEQWQKQLQHGFGVAPSIGSPCPVPGGCQPGFGR